MAYSNSSKATGTANSDTVTATNNSANGDKVLLFIRVPGDTAPSFTGGIPSGFSYLGKATYNGANSGRPESVSVYWKDEATAPANYTVTVAGGNGRTPTLHVVSWSGRATGVPTLIATNDAGFQSSPHTTTLTGFTAVAGDDACVVPLLSSDTTAGAWVTALTNYTLRQESSSIATGTMGDLASLTRDNLSAGATGSLAPVSTNSGGSADSCGVVIQLAVAAGAGGLNTALNSSSNMSAALTSGIKLAASVVAVAALVGSLSTVSNYATSLKSSPSLTAALSTSISLGSNFSTTAKEVSALTNWSTVTLAGTLYNGNGSAVSPYLWTQGPTPPVGSTLYYDATYITIYSDASSSSSQANAAAIVQWYDGVQWWISELVYTNSEVTYFAYGSTLTNALTSGIPLLTANQAKASITPNLTTIVSLATVERALGSLTAAMTTGINSQSALSSTASIVNSLSTAITLQTAESSKALMTATFSTALNASLGVTSKLTAAMTTGIVAQSVLSSTSGFTATFALPDTSIQAALATRSMLTSALTTGVQLQTAEVSNGGMVNALTSQIKLGSILSSTAEVDSTLTGSAAALQNALASRASLTGDLYAYKAVFANLTSSSALNSSLGTVSSLLTTLECASVVYGELIVVPVPLPPTWRCVTVGPLELETAGRALPDKDPEDTLDYAIILDVQLSVDDPLKSLVVSVEASVPDETPMALTIDNALWAMSDPASGIVDTIVFWLSGGTQGVTYVLRLEALDTETVPHTRMLVRRATITVAKQ